MNDFQAILNDEEYNFKIIDNRYFILVSSQHQIDNAINEYDAVYCRLKDYEVVDGIFYENVSQYNRKNRIADQYDIYVEVTSKLSRGQMLDFEDHVKGE